MLMLVLILHVIVCFLIIILVLLQSSKSTDMGSMLGSSNQPFLDSSNINSFLGKATAIVAILFMFTSISIGYMHTKKHTSIMINKNIVNQPENSKNDTLKNSKNLNKKNKVKMVQKDDFKKTKNLSEDKSDFLEKNSDL